MTAKAEKPNRRGVAFFAGAAVQGLMLGLLLWEAILAMRALEEGIRIFRYQGF